jgi:hypothetical protein
MGSFEREAYASINAFVIEGIKLQGLLEDPLMPEKSRIPNDSMVEKKYMTHNECNSQDWLFKQKPG